VCGLFLWFWGVWVRICWWASWIDVLCIFVLDHDPSNSGFGLWLKDFGWNPSFFVELGCDSIPGDLVRLRAWGIASPRDASPPPNLVSRAETVCEIHGWMEGVDFSFSSSSNSVRAWRAVHAWSADGPRGHVFVACSSVLELDAFRSKELLGFCCRWFMDRPPLRLGPSVWYRLLTDRSRVGCDAPGF
jgi:hypothetical protein